MKICTGCGCTKELNEIRALYPGALSCCPERHMVGYLDLIVAVEAVLAKVDRNLDTKPWPLKYAAPWRELARLREVMGK